MRIKGLIWLKIFSPGWVVCGMKIDNKEHLSPVDLAKASCKWSWAELGNSLIFVFLEFITMGVYSRQQPIYFQLRA